MASIIRSKKTKIFYKLLIIIFWILIWQIIYMTINKEIIIPSPASVFKKLMELILQKDFWVSVSISFIKTLFGFALALAVGGFLGFVIYFHRIIKDFLSPIITIIRTVPVVSISFIAIFFIQSEYIPIFVAFIMVIPIAIENVYAGIANTDKKYLEMAQTYKFKWTDILKNIYFPSTLPYFISAASIGVGYAWKSSITAEILASVKYGIGDQLYLTKIYLQSDAMFAWTIVIVLLSVIFSKLFKLMVKNYDKN